MIEIKDGQVYRDGALVGVVDGDKLIVPGKLHHLVVKKIEKETGLVVTLANTEGHSATASSPASPVEDKELALESVENLSTSMGNPIDPEPPQDHRGDKTPAFIEWLFRNRPEEAERRYANRKIARE